MYFIQWPNNNSNVCPGNQSILDFVERVEDEGSSLLRPSECHLHGGQSEGSDCTAAIYLAELALAAAAAAAAGRSGLHVRTTIQRLLRDFEWIR